MTTVSPLSDDVGEDENRLARSELFPLILKTSKVRKKIYKKNPTHGLLNDFEIMRMFYLFVILSLRWALTLIGTLMIW